MREFRQRVLLGLPPSPLLVSVANAWKELSNIGPSPEERLLARLEAQTAPARAPQSEKARRRTKKKKPGPVPKITQEVWEWHVAAKPFFTKSGQPQTYPSYAQRCEILSKRIGREVTDRDISRARQRFGDRAGDP